MLLTDPNVDVDVVNGAILRMEDVGADVAYAAEFGGRTELGDGRGTPTVVRRPRSTGARSSRHSGLKTIRFGRLSAMPHGGRSVQDLAVVPKSVVDSDYSMWVRTRLASQKRSDWMSGYLLERLLYKSPRMVRASVSGADLPDVLLKIVKSDDESSCVLGSGGGCNPPIQKAHPSEITVNGRRISPRLIYSIGMPAALAEKLELGHDDPEHGNDLIEMTDQHLSSNRWYAAHPSDAESFDREQRRWNNRLDGYWAMSSLDLGLAKVMPKESGADGADVRSNLPVPFAGTKESRALTVAIDSDLAVVDLPRWAVRFPMTLDYKRKDQGGSVSYNTDEFSIGGQVDRKLAILGDTRVFVGLFADGAVRPREESLKASRHGEFVQFVRDARVGDIRDDIPGRAEPLQARGVRRRTARLRPLHDRPGQLQSHNARTAVGLWPRPGAVWDQYQQSTRRSPTTSRWVRRSCSASSSPQTRRRSRPRRASRSRRAASSSIVRKSTQKAQWRTRQANGLTQPTSQCRCAGPFTAARLPRTSR